MIGQGQDTTRIHTRKKGGPPPHGGPTGKKVEGKKERKKEGETDMVGLWVIC
jgi:hypothetical protein